jgi:glycosyltransferase involved in cell wall biosynthesis
VKQGQRASHRPIDGHALVSAISGSTLAEQDDAGASPVPRSEPTDDSNESLPVSIVIPAHNEGAVIERCLRTLLAGADLSGVEVLVVCNGCKDDTAERALRFGPPVRVLESPIASKSAALNLGDLAAVGFPRFFIDADVQIDWNAIVAVCECLRSGTVLAAAPRVHFDVSRSSWAVRAFYRIWATLPYTSEGMIGSGVYAVSKSGRSRFNQFPSITADDLFVYRCFGVDERRTVADCSFTVVGPRDLPSLVAIKTRAAFGNIELDQRFPESISRRGVGHGPSLAKLLLNPSNWLGLAVYVYVRLHSRLRARRRWTAGDHRRWERDDSSRQLHSDSES